jgi:Type II secretion system protein B
LKSLVPSTMNPPALSQSITPAPLSREPVHKTRKDISQGIPKIEPPPQSKVSGKNKVLVEGKPPNESKPLTAPLDEKKAGQTVIPEKKDVVPGSTQRKMPQTAVSESAINPSLLKLSAIIWYEEPSMRFAMINGLKATEGSVIEGVKVVEIKPTSVRLFYNDRYFELSIDR